MYLYEARQTKNYSMRKVANEALISYQHYCNLETGKRGGKVSFLILYRISKVLDLDIDYVYEKEKEYQEVYNGKEFY